MYASETAYITCNYFLAFFPLATAHNTHVQKEKNLFYTIMYVSPTITFFYWRFNVGLASPKLPNRTSDNFAPLVT